MHPFGVAIEARDIAAALALLSEGVVFRSPAVLKPYRGRAAVAPILHAVSRVFPYTPTVPSSGAQAAADPSQARQLRAELACSLTRAHRSRP